MWKPKMIIVGADKGGVGKTTVTRILRDYLDTKSVQCKYFDSEFPAGDLHRYVPSEIIDINKTSGQMKVFDTIEPDKITVVDLRAGMLSNILVELDNTRMLDDVRSGSLQMVLLHVLGSSITSLDEIVTAAKKIGGGASHFLVKNYINDATLFDWEESALQKMKDVTITIPKLDEKANDEIQKLATSFVNFAGDTTQSRTLRGKVFPWIKAAFEEFGRIKIDERTDA